MSDLDALFRIYGDIRTHGFNPGGPHRDIEHSRSVILQRTADRERYGFDDWATGLNLNHGVKVMQPSFPVAL